MLRRAGGDVLVRRIRIPGKEMLVLGEVSGSLESLDVEVVPRLWILIFRGPEEVFIHI